MKLILSLCLLLAPAFGWTQIEYNQVKRLSKAEFKKLKLERDKFIPLGLKNSSVLIVKCSKESYKQMRRVALLKSLVRNSYDTTAIDKDSRFNELSHNDDNHEKTTGLVSDNVSKSLRKKGIKSQVINEGEESSYPIDEFQYALKMEIVTTMRDPYKAWLLKMTYFFVDRRNNKAYNVCMPTNHDLLDLID